MESEEEMNEAGQVWISTKSILDAADMSKAYKKLSQCSDFCSMAEVQRLDSIQTHGYVDSGFSWDEDDFSSRLYSEQGAKAKDNILKDYRIRKIETRYEAYIEQLNEEILRLRTELALSQAENQRVMTQLEKTQTETGIRLQNIHAHHERKIIKLKSDMEQIYYGPLIANMKQDHLKEISNLRKEHIEQIESIKNAYRLKKNVLQDTFWEYGIFENTAGVLGDTRALEFKCKEQELRIDVLETEAALYKRKKGSHSGAKTARAREPSFDYFDKENCDISTLVTQISECLDSSVTQEDENIKDSVRCLKLKLDSMCLV